MEFPRIYSDEAGETHIGVRELSEHDAPLGPPPNPVGRMTERDAVDSFVAFSVPAGTLAPSHNAPQPYICIVLSGEGEVSASDGSTARLGPGGVLYCDDVTAGEASLVRAAPPLLKRRLTSGDQPPVGFEP